MTGLDSFIKREKEVAARRLRMTRDRPLALVLVLGLFALVGFIFFLSKNPVTGKLNYHEWPTASNITAGALLFAVCFGAARAVWVYLDDGRLVEPARDILLDDMNSIEAIGRLTPVQASHLLLIGARRRLQQEQSRLQRSANINLLIGIISASVGVAVLATSAFRFLDFDGDSITPKLGWDEAASFMVRALPKIGLALLIEIVAFFFLRLYKYCIDDVKFLLNEITNIEIKFMAIVLASGSTNADALSDVVRTLGATERNFVIKKDERTIDIVRDEVSAEGQNSFLDKIAALVKVAQGRS